MALDVARLVLTAGAFAPQADNYDRGTGVCGGNRAAQSPLVFLDLAAS